MSTIKRVVLCVALLSAAANGLRLGDKALDQREDVDAASSSKEDFASRLADSAGKAVLLADADTTLKEAVEGSSEIGKLKTTSGGAKALDTEFSASGVADELHKIKGVSEGDPAAAVDKKQAPATGHEAHDAELKHFKENAGSGDVEAHEASAGGDATAAAALEDGAVPRLHIQSASAHKSSRTHCSHTGDVAVDNKALDEHEASSTDKGDLKDGDEQGNITDITSRRLQSGPNCPAGMYDATGGNANYWGCGSGCAGGLYADVGCGCACQCLSGVPANLINSNGPCAPFDPSSTLVSYWDDGACGPRGDDAQADLSQCPYGSRTILRRPRNDHGGAVASIDGCDYYEYTVYECNYPARLAGSKNRQSVYEGRVEVFKTSRGWGTVSDDGWGINEGKVVCQQIFGLDAEETFGNNEAYFGEGSGPIWLDELDCDGTEGALSLCPSKDCWPYCGGGLDNHGEDAGVRCERCPAGQKAVATSGGLRKYQCTDCPAGQNQDALGTGCKPCPEGFVAPSGGQACRKCDPGEESNEPHTDCVSCADGWISSAAGNMCTRCAAGEESNEPHTDCVSCADGWISSAAGNMCTPCAAGEESNEPHTDCVSCADGWISSAAGNMCTPCAAGEESNGAHTGCESCDPGWISSTGGSMCTQCAAGAVSNSAHTKCETCGPGTFSNPDQTECTPCGDTKFGGYNKDFWDPTRSGLVSSNQCKCARGRTGTSCDQEECAPTTAATSLGFLVLEVQWPRSVRTLSKNEDFVGISGAFRVFDVNGDNYLSIEEARRAIRDGGMAVPLEVSHIWSRNGAELKEGDITMTEMIKDELARLKLQKSEEYFQRPSGSGNITEMKATYPNNHDGDNWSNEICGPKTNANEEGMMGEPPKLTWTVDRDDKLIFQQCVFFNGEALTGAVELNKDISDGGACKDGGERECSYNFQLPKSYKVTSYPSGNLWPVASTTIDVGACGGDLQVCKDRNGKVCVDDDNDNEADGCDLGEVPTPVNYELAFRIAVGADEGFGKVQSIIHVTGANRWHSERYPGVWFNEDGILLVGQSKAAPIHSSLDQVLLSSATTFVAGQTYEIRVTNVDSELTLHVNGVLDKAVDAPTTYVPPDGVGRLIVGWDEEREPAQATISNARFVDLDQAELLLISKQSYCVETKFCRENRLGKPGEMCDYIRVSGSNCRKDLHATYKRSGNCEPPGRATYECIDCFSPAPRYLSYSGSKWKITGSVCSQPASRGWIENAGNDNNNDDPTKIKAYWQEEKCDGSGDWQENPNIKVECWKCDALSADPDLTITRCTTGLQYDGTAMDVFPRMMGTEGVALSWLDTSTVATGYRVYKVDDITVQFAKDKSARLLREVVMRGSDCGLTHDYVDFRDVTTGSEPGIYVGYAVVPLDNEGAEDKEKVGKNGFVVTWFGDFYVDVEAEGGGPVKNATVKLSHLIVDEDDEVAIDPAYTNFSEASTDDYGVAHLEVRVQDRSWSGLTQHFRLTVEKTSRRENKPDLVHEFEPSFQDVPMRHLGQGTFEFTDMTSVVISGTVSHLGFDAAYFAADCPHTKSEDPTDCMCPVDGAEVFIIRASGAKEEVVVNDGKFATAVFDGETVTIGLKKYNGTSGDVPHHFSVAYDYTQSDCTEPGTIPNFRGSGRTLRCIVLPNGELVDVLEVEGGKKTCKYTDANSCPAGYDIWVPRSYDHAKAVVDAVDPKFTHLVGVYREEGGCGGCTDVAMNSDAYDAWMAVAPTCAIKVESAGYTDGNMCSFSIDSTPVEYECSRGFNLLVLDANDCLIVGRRQFDTSFEIGAAVAMKTYVEGLSSGTVVLVAVMDEASEEMTSALETTMTDAFGVQELTNLGYRDSYAAILVKGYDPLSEQRKAEKKGSATASMIPRVPWTSVAGSPWFLRETPYEGPSGGYTAGCWLTTNHGGHWQDDVGFNFNDNYCNYCFKDYLCSRNGGTKAQNGAEPTFTYTADDDAVVHFLDISTQTLSARYVVGTDRIAEYVNGVPVVAKVERCGWERPVWALRGVATFELGAAALEVRALGDEEALEAKYYYKPKELNPNRNVLGCSDLPREIVELSDPPEFKRGCRAEIPEVDYCTDLITISGSKCALGTDGEFFTVEREKRYVREVDGYTCNGKAKYKAGGPVPSWLYYNGASWVVGTQSCGDDADAWIRSAADGNDPTKLDNWEERCAEAEDFTLNSEIRLEHPLTPECQTERLPCATMEKTYVDQLPTTRIFDVDLSILGTGSTSSVEFVIVSPLCLDEVDISAADPQPEGRNGLQYLVDSKKTRKTEGYQLGPTEELLLLSELPDPVPEGLYGTACTPKTGAVFREGDVVDLGFKLVEREPVPKYVNTLYPWDMADCEYKNTPPSADHSIAIRVADGVSGIEDSGEYVGTSPFIHQMTTGKPNPFTPFSHELSVEFTRAFDGAEILFVRHALVLGVIEEEVPQVWTVATNPTLIFLILRDPPGGGSFTSLTEGSTISTSMAIDGSHAAELENNWQLGASVGYADNIRTGLGWMVEVEKNGLAGGISGGTSYAQTPVDVSVSRATSRHFDVGISFSTGISTSSSPYLAGQPSDIIVGGGANLRFISAIEIFAKVNPEDADGLCLEGRTAKQFLPEQVSTWVMSIYEIEKTVERLGAALVDPNTKLEAKPGVPDPREDIPRQIANWQTVLSNYRAASIRDQAESVAEQLSQELDQFQVHFKKFLAEAKDGKNDTFKSFLVDGLNQLGGPGYHAARGAQIGAVAGAVGGPVGAAIGAAVGSAIGASSAAAGTLLLNSYDSRVDDRVNRAAGECVSAAKLADPSGNHTLCKVYDDIKRKMELKESLFGICDFKDGIPSVEAFCKRDHYRSEDTESKLIGAFDALHDTTQFITFSGSTGLEFSWDIAESRGAELTSTHDATMADALGSNIGGGFNIGRRRLESTDGGVPGYAYPTSGRVLAVSKKLLEVTPEALARRRLEVPEWAKADYKAQSSGKNGVPKGGAKTKPESADNPCRRRLDGLELSDEERRRLGLMACAGFEGGTSSSFAVSLGRAASKDAEHSRSVSIFLGDDNTQDVFAVKISQDAIYGTPIFTTMGGRSSCVGETGTTRRDSRVTIKEIKPLCVSDEDLQRSASDGEALCKSMQTCECKDLAPGKDAIFSVVLENLSPWVDSVTYLLRAGFGASTAWDSVKYTGDIACDRGDPGDLAITDLSLEKFNLRDGTGIVLDPLDYGQFEVKIKVSLPDFALSCFSFQDIELELVSECENTDVDGRQDVYQYQALMNPDNGAVSVVHPKFVGRPVGDACASGVTLNAATTSAADATYHGDGQWCYSDLNLAVGCKASPAACWTSCGDKVMELNEIKEEKSMAAAASAGCPISFIQQTDDKGEKFKCAPGKDEKDETFVLKAIDWEEVTGQCRCQHNCDCLVEDLYSYDVTKPKDDSDYKTRETITHLLTKDGLTFPPKEREEDDDVAGAPTAAPTETIAPTAASEKDPWAPYKHCGLFTFKEDTAARGPETSTATFDVSWKQSWCPEGCVCGPDGSQACFGVVDPEICTPAAVAELILAKQGCTYPEATNYDEEAKFDDGSCKFGARLEPVMIEGSFCISGVNMTEASSTEEMLRVLVGVVTGLTDGASFSFNISPASSCAPTRRLLEDSASVVKASYSIGVQSHDLAEANSIADVLKDPEQLNVKLHEINQAAIIETADALVLATTPTDGPSPGPTPAPIAEETEGPTVEPTPGPTPCRVCLTQTDCDGSEICVVPSARRGLRFGSIYQEGCCRAR